MARSHSTPSQKVSTTKKAAKSSRKKLCGNLPRPVPQFHPNVSSDPRRVSAIIGTQSKWANGTVLHYCFYQGGHFDVPKIQADAIRDAFAKWKAVGIGLQFQEVSQLTDAEVRIGYSEQDGSSASAVGRDILEIPSSEPTTVYGWDLTSPYGRGTALHELGHVLGMEHEHQSPYAGIQWNEEAVYAEFSGPPNSWSHDKIYHNIIEKLSPQQVQGSQWDPDSIMEYEFGPGLIKLPHPYDVTGITPPATLSDNDKAWALKWYPPMPSALPVIQPFQSSTVQLAAGQQIDYAIKPTETRKYTIETKGATDALLVLFEDVNGVPRLLAGDDDSGEERNASISVRLFSGRSYIARLRVFYPGQTGNTMILVT